MKWKDIITKALKELEQSADVNAVSVRVELEKQLHDKDLKWKIFKKWIIASIVQLIIQIASILFGVFI